MYFRGGRLAILLNEICKLEKKKREKNVTEVRGFYCNILKIGGKNKWCKLEKKPWGDRSPWSLLQCFKIKYANWTKKT